MRFHYFIKLALIVIGLNLGLSQKANALDPRAEVMLSVTGYGVAAGTLLGVASLAFDTEARAIAIGASLGLYAGILFGAYIVLSHHYKKANPDTDLYPEGESLYRLDGSEAQYYWEDMRMEMLKRDLEPKGLPNRRKHDVPLYLNFLNYSF